MQFLRQALKLQNHRSWKLVLGPVSFISISIFAAAAESAYLLQKVPLQTCLVTNALKVSVYNFEVCRYC